jgi:hypothetical protein
MALDYSSLLTDEQKKSILEQRLTQFAAEAYQHDINKQVASSAGNAEGVAQAEQALEALEAAIAVHQAELGKIAE